MLLQDASAFRDGFAETYRRAAARALEPSVWARLAARVRGASLDRALIAGINPTDSAVLAARAAYLTSARNRTALAAGLERMVQLAQRRERRRWNLTRRETVLANSSELHLLASLLLAETPVYARGVAMLERLLTDGTGPAYGRSAERFARALAGVRAAMDG